MRERYHLTDIVLEILKGTNKNEILKRYYLFVKRIVAKKVRLYFTQADHRELEQITEDITQDFFLWLLREDLKKKFTLRKARLTNGYLLKKINNLILDYLRKKDTLNKYIPYSIDNVVKGKNFGEEKTFSDLLPKEDLSYEKIDWYSSAIAFLKTLEKNLKEKEIKTLCHWIFREKHSADCFLNELTKMAKYKRVERLKSKLREILNRNPIDEEEWQVLIELLEFYCQKRFGKCV